MMGKNLLLQVQTVVSPELYRNISGNIFVKSYEFSRTAYIYALYNSFVHPSYFDDDNNICNGVLILLKNVDPQGFTISRPNFSRWNLFCSKIWTPPPEHIWFV